MRWWAAALAVCAMVVTAGCVSAGPIEDLQAYRTLQATGMQAYKAGDYPKAEAAFTAALAGAPQRYELIYDLAATAARAGDTDKALTYLKRLPAYGVAPNIAAAPAFAGLKDLPAFKAVLAAVAEATAPRCSCTSLHEGTAAPFIAEGLAHDELRRRWLVSSIYGGKIVAVGADGETTFAALPRGLSPLGLKISRDGKRLWVAASALPQSHGAGWRDPAKGAVLVYDLATGALVSDLLTTTAESGKRAINDVALDAADGAFVSDSLTGEVFHADGKGLTRITTLASPQGMVASRDGRTLLVADYAMGLVRIDLANGALSAIAVPANVTTLALDGLVEMPDHSFVATQNGVAPVRVVHFRLTPDWSAITDFAVMAQNAPEIADPSLLAAEGDAVVAVGVSQWAAFDEDKPEPTQPPKPWRLVRIEVPPFTDRP